MVSLSDRPLGNGTSAEAIRRRAHALDIQADQRPGSGAGDNLVAGFGADDPGVSHRGPFDRAIIFWRGTSGHPYVHTIYSLTGCPEVPPSVILLVRSTGGSSRSVLCVMTVEGEVPSLNLAVIRQAGASIGANEVHAHFASGSRIARLRAAIDLKMCHLGSEPVGL